MLAPCSETFQRAVKRLMEVAAESFPADARVPHAAVQLDGAVSALKLQPTHENALTLIRRLEDVTVELRRELECVAAARAWYAERELRNLTGALFEFCGAAPDAQWLSLPERIDAIPVVHQRKREFVRELRQAGCDRRGLARQDGARLAGSIEKLRNTLEYRARELWVAVRSGGGERDFSVQELYAWSWSDLLAGASVSAGDVERAAARCREVACRLGLGEIAEFFEPPERICQYALNYLIAPAPLYWRFDSPPRAASFLNGQISRWYFRPFRHTIRPLELLPPVLRAGRPLYYERPVAHALLQYQLVQAHLPPSKAYFEILGVLERNFAVLFEAYLLRVACLTRLKSAEAWSGYLEGLLRIHFGEGGGAALWEQEFTLERGLASAHQVLFGPGACGSVH